MQPSSTLAAASALFLAMTVAGQTTIATSASSATSAASAASAASESNASATAAASSTITSSALSASGSGTYIPIFEAGSTTLGVNGFAGSIIGANAVATTIQIVCADLSECDDSTITLTEGPSTWAVDYSTKYEEDGITATVSVDQVCNIVSSTESATCTVTAAVSAEYDGQSSKTTTTATETFTGNQIFYDQLLITAGVDKLNSPSATETPSGAAGAIAAPLPTGHLGMGVGGVAAAAVVAVAGLL